MQADVRTNDSTQINKTIIAKTIRKSEEQKTENEEEEEEEDKKLKSLYF